MNKILPLILILYLKLINNGAHGQERLCRDPEDSELDGLLKKNIIEHAYLLVNDISLSEKLKDVFVNIIFPSNHRRNYDSFSHGGNYNYPKLDCKHFEENRTYSILCPHIYEIETREVIINQGYNFKQLGKNFIFNHLGSISKKSQNSGLWMQKL